jgi:hypothetical protein
MLDGMKMVRALFKIGLAVILPAMLLISCSSSTPPAAGGGGGGGTVDPLNEGVFKCYFCHYPDDAIERFAGMDIFEKWLNGTHGNNETIEPVDVKVNNHPDNFGFPYFAESSLGKADDCTPGVDCSEEPGCSLACHDQLGDGEWLEEAALDFVGLQNRPIIGCESCHVDGTEHANSAGLVTLPVPGPDICGDCHDVEFDFTSLALHPDPLDLPLLDIVIADTHFDDPATNNVDLPNIIEGYTMDVTDEQACIGCHDVHSVDNTINEQWAESAHAGNILTVKELAATGTGDIDEVNTVSAVGVTSASGDAWLHYDWDNTNNVGIFGPPLRFCQRCHTATGARNYLDDPVGYDYNNNDFSHLEGWTADPSGGNLTTSGQNELLYCWGCHDSVSAGSVRDPGPLDADYLFEDNTNTFPDVTASNVCIACHVGREGGKDVKAVDNPAAVPNITDQSFIDSHYLAAAGVLFKAIGYEYEGRDYANLFFFAHDEIGTVVADVEVRPGTGTSGPCVACHMNGAAVNHTFNVVEKDGSGVITGINADLCVTCHDGEHVLFVSQGLVGEMADIWDGVAAVPTVVTQPMADDAAADLEEEKEGFENALYALSAILKDRGFEWTSSHPYFSNTDWTAGGTYSYDQARQILGAAFNLNMLLHEPGAYAHNRYYAKRLLIDSLDFAFNGVLEALTPNGSYYDDSDAGDAIIAAAAGALTYNDHNGDPQVFSAAQRDSAYAYLDASSTLTGFQRR